MTWDELRAEAFGEIGINPTDFYMMEREDYWLLHEGYYNKRIHFMQDLRWAVTPIVSVWSKEFDPYRHMALRGDDELKKRIKMGNKLNDADRIKRMREFAGVVNTLKRPKLN